MRSLAAQVCRCHEPPCCCTLQVNARLARQEELSVQGDPAFPKVQFPPAALCPLCRAPSLDNVSWHSQVLCSLPLLHPWRPDHFLSAACSWLTWQA